jgi:TM2 domain-containing membrane protein YozV
MVGVVSSSFLDGFLCWFTTATTTITTITTIFFTFVVVVVAKDERDTVDQQIDKFLNVLNGPYTMLKPFQRHQTIAVHHQKREE